MKMMIRLTLIAVSLGLVVACQQGAVQKESQTSSGTVLATVNGVSISEKDIEDQVASQLRQVRMDLYAAHKAGVDRFIDEYLLKAEAEKRGVSSVDLQKQEIADKVDVTDKELKDYYEKDKARFQDRSFDEVKGPLQGYLYQQKYREAYGAFLVKLRKKAKIELHIEPPRVKVEEGNHPAIGPEDAPVVIIEFSDYQCPFCGRSRPTVNQILGEYGKKVRYVFRDFPLSFHKDAQKAHEAAHCAHEQGKYWEYNKKLFAQQSALTIDDLKKYAQELALKQEIFEECLSSDKYQKMVQESLRYGQSVGVSGTPAFFVNGRMLSGAQPFSAFQEIIEDELSRAN